MKHLLFCLLSLACAGTMFAAGLNDSAIEERLRQKAAHEKPREQELQFSSTIRIVPNIDGETTNNVILSPEVVRKMRLACKDRGNYILVGHRSDPMTGSNESKLVTLERFSLHHVFDLPKDGFCYSYDGYKALDNYFDYIADTTGGFRHAIKAMMSVAAIVGCEAKSDSGERENDYIGPFWICCGDIYSSVTTDSSGKPRGFLNHFPKDLLSCLLYKSSKEISGYPQGTYRNSSHPDVVFDYEVEIQWKGTVPSQVTLRIDLSPMKDKLYRTRKIQK